MKLNYVLFNVQLLKLLNVEERSGLTYGSRSEESQVRVNSNHKDVGAYFISNYDCDFSLICNSRKIILIKNLRNKGF